MSLHHETNTHLSMSELRGLVSELNTDRARLTRSLTLMADDTGEEATRVREHTQARHDAVVAAIERVADDTYGVCVRCGEGIPYGRLLVMPEVTHCVTCQG
ncbi:MAG: TraR/DksA C4-type zinc finger protein [Gemmatimonadaceae bacterium]|nr:TraR/DksA C4-type zinc finger protein [Gemmatimonadaceae bacterium]